MFSFVKWLFLTLILLLAIAIVIPVAATYLVKQDEVKSRITSWFLENTGRKLNINGVVGFEPGLEIRLFVEDVELQNPQWARRPLAFSAQRAELTIALMPLFRRQIEVNSLMLTGADLWVEYDEMEGSNLQLVDSKIGNVASPRAAPSWFAIKRVDIVSSKILAPAQRSERITTIGLSSASLVADSLSASIDIQANGSINGLRVDLSGSASTLGTVLSRENTAVDLKLTTPGGDKVVAKGNISNVLGWKGIEAQTEFDLPSIPNLSPLFSNRPMDLRSLSGTAFFNQPETVSSMALEQIEGRFEYLDLDFMLKGKIGNLSRLEQFDLLIKADEKLDLTRLLPSLNEKNEKKLTSELSAAFKLTGSAQETQIDIDEFAVVLGDITSRATGGFSIIQGDWDTPIKITLSIPNLSAVGDRLDLPMPDVGVLRGTASLFRDAQQFRLSDIQISNEAADVSIIGTGELKNLGKDVLGEIRFDANATEPFFLQSYFDLPLVPATAKTGGTLAVSKNESVVRLDMVSFELPGGVLTGDGLVDGLVSGSDVKIQLTAIVDNWSALSEALEKSLPDLGLGKINAELVGNIGKPFSLKNINGLVTQLEKQASIIGNLENLGEVMQGDLSFSVLLPQKQVSQLIPALQFSEAYLVDQEQVQATGDLQRSEGGQWSLRNLEAETRILGALLGVTGEFTELAPPVGRISVSVEGELDQEILSSNQALPPLGSVNLSFEIPIQEGNSTIEKLEGIVNGPAGELRLSSKNIELKEGVTGVFDVRLLVADTQRAFPSVKVFRENVPLNAELELRVESARWLARSRILSGTNDFEGTIALDLSGERPRLEIEGVSAFLDVDTILVPPPKEDRFFSASSMLPEWMERFDGSIKLDAKRFSNHSFDLDRLNAVVNFEQKDVSVRFSAGRGKGTLSGDIDFPAADHSRITVKSNSLPVTAFRSLMRREIFQGGVIDIDIDLVGPGTNLAEILGGGSGSIGLDINDSSIRGSALDSVGADIFSNLLRIFNPFIKKDNLVNVDCGAIRFDVANGKAITRNGLAMKTDRVTLLGAGELSMENEGLKMEIAPKPRKGFGISASSFAKMIRLGGTLSAPSVEASATGFFKSGAVIGAAIFSGGLSLIGQGLLDRLTANENVCALARGEEDEVQEKLDDVPNR